MRRKLATIMVGDIVGSTSQMEIDEEGSVQRFADCLDMVAQQVGNLEGRVFNRAGDCVLAEFPSPVNALRAAMASRGALSRIQGSSPADMRFGIHLADVVEIDGDLRGDGVNIAARIQSGADPGAIDASASVFDQVKRNSPCIFDDLGEKSFAGVSSPLRIYRVRGPMGLHRMQLSESRSHAPVPKRPHSVAVTPLSVASSADDDQRFLAEGITEDLILELGRLKQLFVVSASASMALKEREPSLVGAELGVRYVLSGSVRTLGSSIRLNITLTETDEGRVVWTDRIQRSFDDFVEIFDEITARVAGTVLGRILDADTVAARNRPPESMTAYECYLRGLDYHRRGGVTDQNVRQALDWFEKAIDADPNFARAQAMWVCSASWLPEYDWNDGRARTARALELDPNDAESNRIMGSILMKERKFDAARPYHRKAIELAPHDAYVIGRCAAFHVLAGEPEEALALLEQAEQLDPFLPAWITEERIAANYCLERHTDVLETSASLPFQTRRSRLYCAASLVALEDLEAAQSLISEALSENPTLAQSYFQTGETYQNREILKQLIARLEQAGLPR